ncbi:cobalamin-binding protein [Shewanella sp. 1CM18E]|uniref:cobalamin-binding protein n=1 Tax=Shewanella sp. 1CM18E TaxID=2929169 RepID=UPI0020BE8AF3|nr:cobalamin-binding protein [Shewanella sp. 1CM18E]MCK8044492.1 cobalamin-binding protein [Shewanella sp. 1CM18E]
MNILYKLSVALSLFISVSALAAEPAKRIVALSPHSVEMLYAIGAGDSIVATTEYADFPEAALNIPRIGGYHGVQIERILELEPDLVVVWASGNKLEDIQRIKELGFKVFDSNPKTLEAVADELEALGELTGSQAQAKQAADDYRAKLAQLRSDNFAKPEVKVFYQLWSTPLRTVAKDSWIQQIIAVCHGDNVFVDAASDYPQVSLETVVLKDPQVILQSQDEGNIIGINWNEWPEIPAVKNQHIYQLNADLLHRAAPRALLGVEALCNALDKAR